MYDPYQQHDPCGGVGKRGAKDIVMIIRGKLAFADELRGVFEEAQDYISEALTEFLARSLSSGNNK